MSLGFRPYNIRSYNRGPIPEGTHLAEFPFFSKGRRTKLVGEGEASVYMCLQGKVSP